MEPTAKLELGVTAMRDRFAEAVTCDVTDVLATTEVVVVALVAVVVAAVVDEQAPIPMVKAAINTMIR